MARFDCQRRPGHLPALTFPPQGVVSERLDWFRQIESIEAVDDTTVASR